MGQVSRSYINIFSQIPNIESLTVAVLRSSHVERSTKQNNVTVYNLNPDLDLGNLTIFDKTKSMFFGFFKLRRIINHEQFDLIVTLNLEPNFLALIYKTLFSSKSIVVITEHTDLLSYYSRSTFLKNIFRSIAAVLYKNGDYYIGCSKSVTKSLLQAYSLPRMKAWTIYNSIREDLNIKTKNKETRERYICVLGRLDENKGFRELIIALASYLRENSIKLLIVGEGKYRRNLEELIRELNITEYVKLMGYLENPSEIVKNSWVFVSSSFLEGMPLNIIEAMSLSVPVIATDCNSGPREIIAPESCENLRLTTSFEIHDAGILIPTPNHFSAFKDSLVTSLNQLHNQDLYKKISENALQRSLYFQKDRIIQEWIKFLEQE